MKYKALTGLNYPDGKGGEKRAEAGDILTDLSTKVIKAYLESFKDENGNPVPMIEAVPDDPALVLVPAGGE